MTSGTDTAASDSASLVDVLEEIKDADGDDSVTFRSIVAQFDSRSFGPLLLIPAIIAVGPTGAIPGMSLVTGTIILMISVQILAGRKQAWLPSRAEQFEIDRAKLKTTVQHALPWARWIDSFLKPRLVFLVEGLGLYGIAVISAVLAMTMFPLALLPFAVAIPGSAVILFALGLTIRDGLLVAAGHTLAIAAVGLSVFYSSG
ncbi:MAG: exopolysaccharide biosynthesis protein [Pseudomonadota bacterium]